MTKIRLTYELEYKGPLYAIMGSPGYSFTVAEDKEEVSRRSFEAANPDWQLRERRIVSPDAAS